MNKITNLGNVEDDLKSIIEDFIQSNDITPTTFAKSVNVHPAQILGFINGKSGLTLATITRIGRSEYWNRIKKGT